MGSHSGPRGICCRRLQWCFALIAFAAAAYLLNNNAAGLTSESHGSWNQPPGAPGTNAGGPRWRAPPVSGWGPRLPGLAPGLPGLTPPPLPPPLLPPRDTSLQPEFHDLHGRDGLADLHAVHGERVGQPPAPATAAPTTVARSRHRLPTKHTSRARGCACVPAGRLLHGGPAAHPAGPGGGGAERPVGRVLAVGGSVVRSRAAVQAVK
jgi:hypothetical protein